MDVRQFLVDSAVLERRLSADAYRGNTYMTGVTVACRWIDEVSVLRGADRREVLSSASISLLEEVSEGDRVTDRQGVAREVVRVRLLRDLRGNFSHYRAFLA